MRTRTTPRTAPILRPHLGVSARRRARTPARRTVGAQGAARDQRLQGRGRQARLRLRAGRGLRGPAGRRFDGVRRVDLLRRLSRQDDESRAQSHEGRLDVAATGASRGLRTGACSTTARRPIPTASPWSERKKLHVLGRGREEVGRSRHPGFPRRRKRRRRRPNRVRPASTRTRAAIRSSCSPTDASSCSRPARSKTVRCRPTTNRWTRSCATTSTRSSTTRRCASGSATTTPTTAR